GVSAGPRLEIDLDQRHTRKRARFNMLDAAAQREESLERIGNVGFDLLRRHSVVEGRDHDDRDIDLGKKVDRHARQRHSSNDRNHQAEHDDEEGIAKGKTGHYWLSPLALEIGVGATVSPSRYSERLTAITRSPSFTPLKISIRLGVETPTRTVFFSTLFAPSTVSTKGC